MLLLFNTTRKTSGLHTGARYRMDAARRCYALNTAPKVDSPYRYRTAALDTPPRFPHRGVGPAPAPDLLGKAAPRHSGRAHCRRAARRARQIRGPRPHSLRSSHRLHGYDRQRPSTPAPGRLPCGENGEEWKHLSVEPWVPLLWNPIGGTISDSSAELTLDCYLFSA